MKKIKILSLAVLSLGFASCDGFLNQEPVLTQSNEIVLSDYEGLNSAVLGAYSPLQSVNWYGANFILSAELRGGNAKNPTNTQFTSGRYTTEYNWNFTSAATSPVWNTAYYVISAANNVINKLEGKAVGAVTIDDLNNLKAECLFLRALAHFDLVRTYAQPFTYQPNSLGVPVVLESKIALPARNTVAEVYDQVVKDLLEAETIMADDYTRTDVSDVTAIASKQAIQALLSRVYLYMGNWQKSADYATKVINSGKYNMFTADNYASQWTKNTAQEGGEIIFEVFASKKNSYWGSWDVISWLTTPGGYADVASTADLRNLYETGDVRGDLFISHADAPDHFWTLKYAGKAGTNPLESNTVVLRLSEMYLNRAEAIYRGAVIPGVTADADLLKITSNRGATPVSASATTIFKERQKELAFEGHIIYDYARTQTSLVRTDYDGAIATKDITFPSHFWALPIPKREMDANPNMVQNDQY